MIVKNKAALAWLFASFIDEVIESAVRLNSLQNEPLNKPLEEQKMRNFFLAGVAAVALAASAVPMSGIAEAAGAGTSYGIRAAVDELDITQDVQYRQYRFEGRRHCWHNRGWHGPGWYLCGYSARRGRGWGGSEGWNGWEQRRSTMQRQYRS